MAQITKINLLAVGKSKPQDSLIVISQFECAVTEPSSINLPAISSISFLSQCDLI